VIDRLRIALNRPLADADRARLFLVAVAAIVLGAAALALIDDPAEPAGDRLPRAVAIEPADPEAALALPSEEGNPPAAPSRADVATAKAAARRFLAGYLPYSYGQASPRAIEAVSDGLRERLAAEPPRVPEAERRRRPRLVLVQAHAVGEVRAAMLALVTDGARRYTVDLELERRRSGWRVTSVGS
jgi:hypothetical protein